MLPIKSDYTENVITFFNSTGNAYNFCELDENEIIFIPLKQCLDYDAYEKNLNVQNYLLNNYISKNLLMIKDNHRRGPKMKIVSAPDEWDFNEHGYLQLL